MREMRILWVKVGGLWPVNTGGRIRSVHVISELARRHRVTLLTTHRPEEDPHVPAAQLSRCERVVSLPYAAPKAGSTSFALALLRSWATPLPVDLWKWRVPELRAEAFRLVGTRAVDLCVADFLTAMPNVPLGGPVPVVFFEHNVEHMIWKRLSEIETRRWRRALLGIEWRKMRRYEAHACTRANTTIAVSEVDRALLAANAPGANVVAIPTGVDTSYFAPNGIPEAPAHLVFTGTMDWYPNEDAVLHLMNTILPSIRREIPEVSVTVAGRNPSPRVVKAAGEAGVRVTGTVDDIRPYIAEAAVYVVPLRVGSGTRLKIFEALAMAKAVVSTSVGAEGLSLVPGAHFLRADDPAEFARAVTSLLRDSARRRALGTAGRRFVEERYSWPKVAAEFETRCHEVVANAR